MKKLMLKQTQKQSGAVLVLSLLMLFVLTLVGVSSLNTTTLEEKMSGNTRNQQLAFHAAEMAIRQAEDFIVTRPATFNPITDFTVATAANGLYPPTQGPSNTDATDKTWWATGSGNGIATYAGTIQDITTPPQYTIEYVGEAIIKSTDPELGKIKKQPTGVSIFLITARGTGLTANASVVIQSRFGRITQ